jgi:peroxiredoxin
MKKMLKVIWFVMLIPVLLITGCSRSEIDISGIGSITACDEYTGQSLKIGDPAPVFQFQNAAEQTVALSDFKGKVVLINFWQIECYWCRQEMAYIQQVYDEWQGKGLVVLAINIAESPSNVAKFIQDNGLSFPVLLDSEVKVTRQYYKGRYLSIPITFFIDKEGIIQHIQVGAFSSKEQIESILSQLD